MFRRSIFSAPAENWSRRSIMRIGSRRATRNSRAALRVARPHDDYQLGIQIKKLTVNETIARGPVPSGAAGRKRTGGSGQRRQGSAAVIQHMIVQNVLHRPIRTLITVVAVAVEVMLVIMRGRAYERAGTGIGKAHRRASARTSWCSRRRPRCSWLSAARRCRFDWAISSRK